MPSMLGKVVIRRVGGLEDQKRRVAVIVPVIRRVGGLEDLEKDARAPLIVIRRVGGLEVLGLFCACP